MLVFLVNCIRKAGGKPELSVGPAAAAGAAAKLGTIKMISGSRQPPCIKDHHSVTQARTLVLAGVGSLEYCAECFRMLSEPFLSAMLCPAVTA